MTSTQSSEPMPRHSSDTEPGTGSYVAIADVVVLLIRRRRTAFGIPLALGLLGFLYFQFMGSYIAESTFRPEESGSALGALGGLAAQFGVDVPPGVIGEKQSVDFYVALLRSPQVLFEVAKAEYRFAKVPGEADSLRGKLVQFYGVSGDTPNELNRGIIKTLQGRITVSSDRLAGVVSLRVKAPWPELAQQINRRLLDIVNEFNVEKRQTQASAERKFVEARVGNARSELTTVEDSMQRFLEQNRTYETSPRLAFEAARLQRRISLRQGVYTTLAQAHEQARIEEVRNTPVLTIIQQPELFYRRSRNQFLMGLLAAFAGLVFSVSFTLVREHISRELRREPAEIDRIRTAIPDAWWRLLPRRWVKTLRGA